MGGTGAGLQLLQRLGEAYVVTAPDVDIQILSSLGTDGGSQALADRVIDIAVTSEPLKPEEAEKGLREIATARTPFVLVTSRSAPEPLQANEVAAAFGGEKASWLDNDPIRIVLRPETESDTRLLEQYFPGMSEALARARLRPEVPVAATDQDNATAAEEIEGSLTSATLVQMLTEARDLRRIWIDGVEPTLENLETGRYPYEKTLHFLVLATARPAASGFAQFLRSEAAAVIMRDVGILRVGQ
jgi:phosphate transport system substrate-binding protein